MSLKTLVGSGSGIKKKFGSGSGINHSGSATLTKYVLIVLLEYRLQNTVLQDNTKFILLKV